MREFCVGIFIFNIVNAKTTRLIYRIPPPLTLRVDSSGDMC
jgi:hypothetical protein